jgi:hypothetical protein
LGSGACIRGQRPPDTSTSSGSAIRHYLGRIMLRRTGISEGYIKPIAGDSRLRVLHLRVLRLFLSKKARKGVPPKKNTLRFPRFVVHIFVLPNSFAGASRFEIPTAVDKNVLGFRTRWWVPSGLFTRSRGPGAIPCERSDSEGFFQIDNHRSSLSMSATVLAERYDRRGDQRQETPVKEWKT